MVRFFISSKRVENFQFIRNVTCNKICVSLSYLKDKQTHQKPKMF